MFSTVSQITRNRFNKKLNNCFAGGKILLVTFQRCQIVKVHKIRPPQAWPRKQAVERSFQLLWSPSWISTTPRARRLALVSHSFEILCTLSYGASNASSKVDFAAKIGNCAPYVVRVIARKIRYKYILVRFTKKLGRKPSLIEDFLYLKLVSNNKFIYKSHRSRSRSDKNQQKFWEKVAAYSLKMRT